MVPLPYDPVIPAEFSVSARLDVSRIAARTKENADRTNAFFVSTFYLIGTPPEGRSPSIVILCLLKCPLPLSSCRTEDTL